MRNLNGHRTRNHLPEKKKSGEECIHENADKNCMPYYEELFPTHNTIKDNLDAEGNVLLMIRYMDHEGAMKAFQATVKELRTVLLEINASLKTERDVLKLEIAKNVRKGIIVKRHLETLLEAFQSPGMDKKCNSDVRDLKKLPEKREYRYMIKINGTQIDQLPKVFILGINL